MREKKLSYEVYATFLLAVCFCPLANQNAMFEFQNLGQSTFSEYNSALSCSSFVVEQICLNSRLDLHSHG